MPRLEIGLYLEHLSTQSALGHMGFKLQGVVAVGAAVGKSGISFDTLQFLVKQWMSFVFTLLIIPLLNLLYFLRLLFELVRKIYQRVTALVIYPQLLRVSGVMVC